MAVVVVGSSPTLILLQFMGHVGVRYRPVER